MSERDFQSFEEFWPFYVKEHRKKATRIMHFVGTTAAMGCLVGGAVTKRRWLLAVAPVVGYGPAWVSHFLIERNKPASWKHPVWSLRADLVMWWKMVRREMDAEVERVLAEEEAKNAGDREPAPSNGVDAVAKSGEVVN